MCLFSVYLLKLNKFCPSPSPGPSQYWIRFMSQYGVTRIQRFNTTLGLVGSQVGCSIWLVNLAIECQDINFITYARSCHPGKRTTQLKRIFYVTSCVSRDGDSGHRWYQDVKILFYCFWWNQIHWHNYADPHKYVYIDVYIYIEAVYESICRPSKCSAAAADGTPW